MLRQGIAIKPGVAMRLLMLMLMLVALPAQADVIRFGYGGSIFGGGMWQIADDDSVTFSAYGIEGGPSLRPGWVWQNRKVKQGYITTVLPGAFARASAIAQKGIGDARLGRAPDYRTNCTDAGSFIVEVDIPTLTYAATVDGCVAGAQDVPRRVRAHHDALKAVTDEIHAALNLGSLF